MILFVIIFGNLSLFFIIEVMLSYYNSLGYIKIVFCEIKILKILLFILWSIIFEWWDVCILVIL